MAVANGTEGWWWSPDGLRLHFRDYPGDPARPPILCLPGLTRNARDFVGFADRIAGRHRVLALDLRGRGESAYAANPDSYVPPVYARDVLALVAAEGITRCAFAGTSLGGIVTMLVVPAHSGLVAGALLNDIGPVIEPAGLERIRSYAGRQGGFPTWLHAGRAVAASHAAVFPGFRLTDWIAMAKRLCRLSPAGRIVFDYDPRIAEAFRAPPSPADSARDPWTMLDGLRGVPALLVRGETSDILSAATAARMVAELPDLALATVPATGHAPDLDDPRLAPAIERWLARLS